MRALLVIVRQKIFLLFFPPRPYLAKPFVDFLLARDQLDGPGDERTSWGKLSRPASARVRRYYFPPRPPGPTRQFPTDGPSLLCELR